VDERLFVLIVCSATGLTRGGPRISEREFDCSPEFLGTGNPQANLEVVAELMVSFSQHRDFAHCHRKMKRQKI